MPGFKVYLKYLIKKMLIKLEVFYGNELSVHQELMGGDIGDSLPQSWLKCIFI